MTPNTLGYRMPAEWEMHEATWLAWPFDSETWPHQLAEVEETYLEIIGYLHHGEKIQILVDDEAKAERVSKKLKERGITQNVFLHPIKTDSIWIRDYGPLFVLDKKGGLAITDWRFNAWGGKYEAYQSDDQVPNQIASRMGVKAYPVKTVLEGGALDTNGLGSGLGTKQCLLNPNRNQGIQREKLELQLKHHLGISHMIWLERGIQGDDTDGHVDEIARFVSRDTVAAGMEQDSKKENFKILKDNYEKLKNATDQAGKALSVVPIPMPGTLEIKTVSFPASYTNFYIGNDVVLVPIFQEANDTRALGILKDLFPNRTVAGIPAVPLIRGLGAIHCITQQQPASIR